MTTLKKNKFIGWTVAAIYLAVLLRLTVFRTDFLTHALFTNGCLHYLPLENYMDMLQRGQYISFIYLFGGNIAWFLPFGFLLPFLTGRPRNAAWLALFGFLLSFLIEFSQFMFGTGDTELDDLILNTLGALLGFWAYRGYVRLRKRKGADETEVRDDSEV